jgi:hypothetical protein
VSPLRRAALLLALGALLAAGRAAWRAAAPVVVEVPVDATADEVDAAVALALGRRRLDPARDPACRRALVEDLRLAGRAGSDEALLAEALALGLDAAHPVVLARQRAAGRAVARPTRGATAPREVWTVRAPSLAHLWPGEARVTREEVAGRLGEPAAAALAEVSPGAAAVVPTPWGPAEVRLLAVERVASASAPGPSRVGAAGPARVVRR